MMPTSYSLQVFTSSERETGLAVLNKTGRIFAVNSVNNRVLWRMQQPERGILPMPSCWTVIASQLNPTAVLVCTGTTFHLGVLESAAQPCVSGLTFTREPLEWFPC